MKNFNLNINEVFVIDYEDMIYNCSIQDITENELLIDIPVKDGEFLILENGERLDVRYCSEAGRYYEFEVKIIGREKGDNIPMYKLSLPMNVRRIQRRNYVRVPVLKTVNYKREEEESWYEATTLDISGGGMKIKAERKFKLGDELAVKIETSSRIVEAKVQIKRCEKVNTNEYIYGLEFTDINENRRDNIIKDVFLVMRKQREII